MSRDDELRELAALAAVGALDDRERTELDAQLAARPDLRAELAELELAVGTLADATAEAPPPSLRAAVLIAVRDVPQEPPAVDAVPVAEPPLAPVVDIATRRRRREIVLAGVAAIAAALIGVVVVQATSGDDGVQIADVVGAADAVSVEMTGDLQGLRMVRSSGTGAIALLGDDVPPPRADQVYELWLIEDEPARVDIFRPDGEGRVELLVEDMAPDEQAVFVVTVEPAGGTESPTGPVVAMTPA